MTNDGLKQIASALGVPATMEHVLARIKELNARTAVVEGLEKRGAELTSQRDEFEKMVHEEHNINCRLLEQYTTIKKRYEKVVEMARQVYLEDLGITDV